MRCPFRGCRHAVRLLSHMAYLKSEWTALRAVHSYFAPQPPIHPPPPQHPPPHFLPLPLSSSSYTNGSFSIPLPRGAVLVLDGYAANGVRHCVRPVDMSGKSAGLILRRINPEARATAKALHLQEMEEQMAVLSLLHDTLPEPSLLDGDDGARCRTGRQLPAAACRDIWRCLASMVQRVEVACQQEVTNALTAQLVLISALRKAEAAERAGVELSCLKTAEVFSLLDDLVSYVERSKQQRQQQQVAAAAVVDTLSPPPRLRPAAVTMAEQEVARCLDVMVRRVEAVERSEQLAIVSVAASMVHCVVTRAAWEAGRRAGPEPPYIYLPPFAHKKAAKRLRTEEPVLDRAVKVTRVTRTAM